MWTTIRKGKIVQVCDDKGNVIADVGQENDPRILRKLHHATLMAAAPDMFEILIDVQELIKREFFIEDHPMLESVSKRCNKIIEQSFKKHGEQNETRLHNRDNGIRRPTDVGGRQIHFDRQGGLLQDCTIMESGGDNFFLESLPDDKPEGFTG